MLSSVIPRLAINNFRHLATRRVVCLPQTGDRAPSCRVRATDWHKAERRRLMLHGRDRHTSGRGQRVLAPSATASPAACLGVGTTMLDVVKVRGAGICGTNPVPAFHR